MVVRIYEREVSHFVSRRQQSSCHFIGYGGPKTSADDYVGALVVQGLDFANVVFCYCFDGREWRLKTIQTDCLEGKKGLVFTQLSRQFNVSENVSEYSRYGKNGRQASARTQWNQRSQLP